MVTVVQNPRELERRRRERAMAQGLQDLTRGLTSLGQGQRRELESERLQAQEQAAETQRLRDQRQRAFNAAGLGSEVSPQDAIKYFDTGEEPGGAGGLERIMTKKLEKDRAKEAKALSFKERSTRAQELRGQAAEKRAINAERNRAEDEIRNLSKDLSRTGVAKASTILAEIDRTISDVGGGGISGTGDIPGVGGFAGFVSSIPGGETLIRATDAKGAKVRQKVAKLFNITLKDRSGAAVTTPEMNRLRTEFGEGKFGTDEQLRDALRAYARELKIVAKQIEAGAPPEALQAFIGQGGFTSENISTFEPPQQIAEIPIGTVPGIQDAQAAPIDQREQQLLIRRQQLLQKAGAQ